MSKRIALAVLLTALGAAWPATAQTIFVTDTFTVGANTMLEAHTPDTGGAWTRQAGGSGIIVNAAADNARNVATGDWSVYTNGTTAPAAEVVVGVTVTFTAASANNFVDLFGRASTSLLSAYSLRIAGAGANNVTISRWSGGTPTVIASATVAITLNSPISVVFSLKNASKQAQINGVTVASTTDNTVTTAGLVALGMQSNGANQTIAENFFASTFAPTAVDHMDVGATRDGTRTLLEWSTAREVQNLGFRIFRDDGHGRVPASRGLIAGAAFMVASASLPAGNTYRWVDADPRAKSARAWWIEDVDLHGHGVWHGPIVPRSGRIDSRAAMSPTFADSVQRNGLAATTRLRPAALADTSGDRRRAAVPFATETEIQRKIAAGDAIKIGVAADGLYRVTRTELLAAGLDPKSDLQSLRLYADGIEVPIAVEDDAILFYGRALDTPSTAMRIYWLVSGEGGLRMASVSPSDGPVSGRRSFLATAERRDKVYFVTFLRDAGTDNFVGPLVSTDAAKPTIQTLALRHIDHAAAAATLTIELQGSSDSDSQPGHRVSVSLNGQHLGEMDFDALARASATFAVPADLLADGGNDIALAALNGDADASTVVSVALTYTHTLDADDGRLLATVDGGAQTSIAGFASNDIEIVDITDPRAPIRIVPLRVENGAVTFIAPGFGSGTVMVIESARLAHVASLARNEPSSLRDAAGADVVIISHPSFVSALEPLVQLRQSQGLSVMVAKSDDVYDEFNFGAKDPQAIRSFLQNARRWQKPPRYVLLAGDASFDPRVYLGLGDFDFLPAKFVMTDLLLTASDTWFTDFDDDGAPDVPIGRLSARVPGDVVAEVNKIVAYETSAMPPPTKILLVSDADPALDFHANSVALEASIPQGFDIIDIDAAASGAAAARQQLLADFSDALLVNYIGHGSVEIWSNGSFFSRDDVAGLPKRDRAPIVVAMTCLNGLFQDLYTDSLAETLQRAPNGAVAVWASSALTSPEVQLPVNEMLLRALLAPGEVRLGDAVLAAQKSSFTPDIRKTFILFGDPAMRVHQ
jgi:hypothetical protein